MSDTYVTPPETAYLVTKPFKMPTDNGDVWAIAFTTDSSQFINAALSVIFTLIFPWIWGLAASVTLYSASRNSTQRRSVALVTLRNAPDPWTAFKGLAGFTYDSVGTFRGRKPGQPLLWQDSLYGLTFGIMALGIFTLGIVMGIIGPPFLQIGNVAPVRSSLLFYPPSPPPDDDLADSVFSALQSTAVLRALSSVDIARVRMRSKVQVTPDTLVRSSGDSSEPMYGLTYSYNITGVDLGLEKASDLALAVTGSCRTEYSWLDMELGGEAVDAYHLWLNRSMMPHAVFISEPHYNYAPRTFFVVHPDAAYQSSRDGNVSYAILVGSAHRASISAGSDPWYATELRNSTSSAIYDAKFWVKRGRPALSCWQQDKWSYGAQTVPSVYGLRNQPGMRVPEVLLRVLESAFAVPRILIVGRAAGASALDSVVSSSDSIRGLIDASVASIHRDMERLVVASFVNSQNVFVDCTLFEPTGHQRRSSNIFVGSDGLPREGADQFVVSTPDVQTFSLTGLITIAVILVALLLVKILLRLKLHLHHDAHSDALAEGPEPQHGVQWNDDRWTRFKALSAVHLLRNVYECGRGSPEQSWKCCEELPKPEKGKLFKLIKCGERDCCCAGHIAIAPDSLAKLQESHVSDGPAPPEEAHITGNHLPGSPSPYLRERR
ncbi:hypothetical protein MFIFM68171_02049 [Madurella fahalii]|uniref:Uncharacterized protein n=1 Tax=Madurella fahalii TaxID=1157608 RepID=A0ABQ0G257_9PEZI